MIERRTVWREGATAGLLGAGGVAVWFLVVDFFAGQPLRTPALLGTALLHVFGRGLQPGVLVSTVAYSVFHVAAFVIIGVIAARLLEASRRVPQVAAGLLILFAVFEVGFYFLATAISGQILGALPWYQVGAANIVAAALTGGYLWRRHPEFAPALGHALDGSV